MSKLAIADPLFGKNHCLLNHKKMFCYETENGPKMSSFSYFESLSGFKGKCFSTTLNNMADELKSLK